MPGTYPQVTYTCTRCLRVSRRHHALQSAKRTALRRFSQQSPQLDNSHDRHPHVVEGDESQGQEKDRSANKGTPKQRDNDEPEMGAMSRRLAEATEEAMIEGGRAGIKAVEEVGFSDELKERLLERVKAQQFKSENAAAFAEANLGTHVARGSRDIAVSRPWDGGEAPEDTVLRMLDDAVKPLKPGLRGPAKIPSPVVDLRLNREPKMSAGQRLANARDKSSIYAGMKSNEMSESEREAWKKELRDRFKPAARAMPTTFRGLAGLANERIEDAIARGQFKNIPRGKAIQRDTRADNPFIDTTEYIMNKMIKRQDIVPPWIEKQQELVRTANNFRARLRNDWKRIAARTIASRGGSLEEQMQRAERYAEAERLYNPKKRAVEEISVPTNVTEDPVMVKITQEAPSPSSAAGDAQLVKIPLEINNLSSKPAVDGTTAPITMTTATADSIGEAGPEAEVASSPPPTPLPPPFRLPEWEAAEMSYLQLAITNLNNLTRSYNLQAPDLAKKSYFSLERELKACYADVAPQLAQAIKERASRPAKDVTANLGNRPGGGVLERLGATDSVAVYDSKKPLYGFKEFWNDLFSKERA
ncbi:hypothetical protein F5884DRAFT_29857 [Xylogone sp. PMI_703]|nr:hypothetical protein F5884DRAFT_29857 [Xylogone sp. PMI_703]